MLCYTHIDTPLGTLVAGATGKGLCLLSYDGEDRVSAKMNRLEAITNFTFVRRELPYFQLLRDQLTDYFEGNRKQFSVPLHLIGSVFQLTVWEAIQQISFAEVRKYRSSAGRADENAELFDVIDATRENPIHILVPVHRIHMDAGTMEYESDLVKNGWLLNHELKMKDKKSPFDTNFLSLEKSAGTLNNVTRNFFI